MNTGHDGSLKGAHANATRGALGRLEGKLGVASTNLSVRYILQQIGSAVDLGNLSVRPIRLQISSAVDLLVQFARLSDGSRKVTHITECVGMEGEQVTTQDVFLFHKLGIDEHGKVRGRFQPTGIRPRCTERLEACGIRLPASTFQRTVEVG
jgi:pilus assembly protein CpaF